MQGTMKELRKELNRATKCRAGAAVDYAQSGSAGDMERFVKFSEWVERVLDKIVVFGSRVYVVR